MNPNRSCFQPYMTNEEVLCELSNYDEQSFQDLPHWLQYELQVRHLPIHPRHPTECEMQETISDAREHRIMNNEKTTEDFFDKYKYHKPFTIV